MSTFIFILDLVGLMAFAASGALLAGKHNLDLFGGLVLAFVAGVGGGTMRDVILDVPVFWIVAPHSIWACVAGFGIVTALLVWRGDKMPILSIKLLDALGLAVFSVLGAYKTLQLGHDGTVAVIMGVLTGVGGGMLRDVLANEVPMVLSRQRLYATASLVGSILFVALASVNMMLAIGLGFIAVLGIRLGALFRDWRLPFFPVKDFSDL